MIDRLHESISAVCPILGVSVPTEGTSVGVRIDFDPAATAQQQTNAQTTLAGFDWSQSAHDAWLTLKRRSAAQSAMNTSTAPNEKLIRALAAVILDEINVLRAAVIPPLSARTFAQLKTAIDAKIDGGSVD